MLYLSAPSYLISSRAETQYYETIFLQANKIFENLKKIKILKETSKKIIEEVKTKNTNKVLTTKFNIKSDDEVSFLTSAAMQLNPKFTFLFPIDFIRLIKILITLFVRLLVDLMIKFNLK